MSFQRPNANEATQTANRSRSVSPVSGIPYIMDAYRQEAEKIINS